MNSDPKFKYWAFISYCHRDKKWGKWLHEALETYRVPKEMVGKTTQRGYEVPARLFPIYRDREESPTAADLGRVIQNSLEQSRYLIAICSPHSARSRWVNEEVRSFKRLGRENRILCIIVDGEPNASDGKPGIPKETECFPEALRFKAGPDGELTSERAEPVCGDVREQGDGKRNALIKLLAGLLGVDYDALKRRDEERERRRFRRSIAVVSSLIVIFAAIAAVALYQRHEARVKEDQIRKNASRADFMVACEKADDRPDVAMAHLVRALKYDPENTAAIARLFSLIRQRSWPQLVSAFGDESHLVRRADLSPDGRRVVTASAEDCSARLWNAATGEPIGMPMMHSNGVSTAVFSPDGERVLTASADGSARLWNAANGKPVGAAMRPAEWVKKAFFSPDGTRVVTVAGKSVQVWDATSGQPITNAIKHAFAVECAVFSPDGRWLATACGESYMRELGTQDRGEARVWDAFTGKPVCSPMRHNGEIKTVSFSPDGQFLVTASWDRTAQVWSAATGDPVGEPMRHSNWVQTAQFSPDGQWVVTGCKNRNAQVWDAKTGKATGIVFGKTDVGVAAFSRDGKSILTAAADGTADVWNAKTGNRIPESMRHQDIVEVAKFGPDERQVLTVAFFSKTAQVWAYRNPVSVRQRLRHGPFIHDAQFSPDGKLVATASDDGTVRVWEALTGRAVGPPLQHTNALLHFMPGWQLLATISDKWEGDAKVLFWDYRNGQLVGTPIVLTNSISASAFSPDGKLALTVSVEGKGSARGKARVWDIATRRSLGPAIEVSRFSDFCSFSSDSRRFITLSDMAEAMVWDVASGKSLPSLLTTNSKSVLSDKYGVNDAVFSPNGRQVAVAGMDSVVSVYDVATGRLVSKPMRHDGIVGSVRFDSTGTKLVTKGNTVRTWRVTTGEPISESFGRPEWVRTVDFDPSGRWLITACTDGTGRIWDSKTGKPVCEALRFDYNVDSASFSSDGRLALFVAEDGASVWPFVDLPEHCDEPNLSLLLEVATYLSGSSFDEKNGQLARVSSPTLAKMRRHILAQRDDKNWGYLVRWLFDPLLDRPVLPLQSPTEREYLQKRTDVLGLACERGNIDLAGLALLAGINPAQTNSAGQTPLAIAMERKDTALLRLLVEHGATTNEMPPKVSGKADQP